MDPPSEVPTSFTIGIDSLEMVRRKVEEAAAWPILKVKLGVPNDMEIIREVRRLCPRKRLRADANGGWTVEEAIAKARKLEKLGVEILEQPVPPGDPAALRRVQQNTSIPVFADESACSPADLPALEGCVKGINIKLAKCGGIFQAFIMSDLARFLGMDVMLGCMVESSVLITAAAHIASLADHLDLDGALLLARDPFEGARFDAAARLVLPEGPGLGVKPRA
jgi:L-alanine-DL-glutamate epimerase-like enolase superfamily enzyme